MRAVHTNDVAPNFNSPHRNSDIGMARLSKGDPGEPDNYEFSVLRIGSGYTTPRHHHNFDQIHYVLEGEHTWAPRSIIPQGHVAYFPEGTFYGPQQGLDGLVLGLQFGGASGSGFMDYDTLRTASEELAASGTFDDGMYRPRTDESTPPTGTVARKDGYEAAWEHVNGKPVDYPAPRYGSPIIVDPGSFAWIPSSNDHGVHHKHLLTVTERCVSIGFTLMDPRAELRLEPLRSRRLQYVVDGDLTVDGKVFGSGTAFAFEVSESPVLSTDEGAEIYWIELPRFSPAD